MTHSFLSHWQHHSGSMHDAAQDASPSNRHATAPELPIWLHFRGPKKVFSRLRGQYLVEGEHVTYIVNRLNEYVPSHFLKFSSSRAVAFARARLLASSNMVVPVVWGQDFCRTIPKKLLRIGTLENANAAYSKTGRSPSVTLKEARILKSSYLPWDSCHLNKSSHFENN